MSPGDEEEESQSDESPVEEDAEQPSDEEEAESEDSDKMPGGDETRSETGMRVGTLTRSNYPRWITDMEDFLTGLRLWGHASGDVAVKEKPAPGAGEAAVKAYEDWKEKDAKAKNIIRRTLDDEMYAHVQDCLTAKDIMVRIRELRDPRTTDVLAKSLADFMSESWQETDTVTSFMARLARHANLVNGCKDESIKLADLFIVTKTLTSLPSRFSTFRESWQLGSAGQKDERSLSKFREALLTSERAMQVHEEKTCQGSAPGDGEEAAALASQSRPARVQQRKQGREQGSTGSLTCWTCNKTGHKSWQCKSGKPGPAKGNKKMQADKALSGQTALVFRESRRCEWIADSGATRHMTGQRDWFRDLRELKQPITLSTAAASDIQATHEGTIDVLVSVDGKAWQEKELKQVLLVPGTKTNLFSTTFVERTGHSFSHGQGKAAVMKDKKPILGATWDGTAYVLRMRVKAPGGNNKKTCAMQVVDKKEKAKPVPALSLDLWHQRLGHVSDEVIKRMANSEAVVGLRLATSQRRTCAACFKGKQTAKTRKSAPPRDCAPGERLHTDVFFAGQTSLGGSDKCLVVKDEASGYRLVRFLKSIASVHEALADILDQAARETGRQAISLRTDYGTEFKNAKVDALLRAKNIARETSAPYVKQQNGRVERENRTLCNAARSLLFQADLDEEERQLLWAEATSTAAYLLNRVACKRSGIRTPHELWHGKTPGVRHLRVFGAPAFVRVPEQKRKQFSAKAREAIFIGYDWATAKILKVYDRKTKKCSLVADVTVIDTQPGNTGASRSGSENRISDRPGDDGVSVHGDDAGLTDAPGDRDRGGKTPGCRADKEQRSPSKSPENKKKEKQSKKSDHDASADTGSDSDSRGSVYNDAAAAPERDSDEEGSEKEEEEVAPPPPSPRKATGSKGARRKPVPAPFHMVTRSKEAAKSARLHAMDPGTRDEALARDDADQWQDAMDDEMKSLIESRTWSLVPRPRNANVVTCKWVLKTKCNADGSLTRRKARLVARGFSQKEGQDFFETFSPVARYESVRCLLSLAASEDMELLQFDVKTAFLNGSLEETVFMEQPPGYGDGTQRVCKLHRSLYGLKQSPRTWNKRFIDFMRKQGFEPVPEDPCIFMRNSNAGRMIVALYVDDGLVAASNKKEARVFLEQLQKEFAITRSELGCYVGMELTRDRKRGTISIRQAGNCKRVLERYGMLDAKPLLTPMDPSVKLEIPESPRVTVPYREAIGSLNFLSQVSRPDITYAVGRLARYASDPRKNHWEAVKRVMRYLKGTVDQAIVYGRDAGRDMKAWCDSDWGGEETEKRSTSGYVFAWNGGPVSWSSVLQRVSAFSAAEAEYMALAEALKECLWLRPFLASLGQAMKEPTLVQVDNKAAICLSRNPEFHKRTKHVGIRYHRVRQEQEQGTLIVDYVRSEDNASDCLTKPVNGQVLQKNLDLLHILSRQQ